MIEESEQIAGKDKKLAPKVSAIAKDVAGGK